MNAIWWTCTYVVHVWNKSLFLSLLLTNANKQPSNNVFCFTWSSRFKNMKKIKLKPPWLWRSLVKCTQESEVFVVEDVGLETALPAPSFLRDCLWKFFLPADYQPMKVMEVAQPGKPRQIQAFELRMNIIADATIDLLFTKNRVTHSVSV